MVIRKTMSNMEIYNIATTLVALHNRMVEEEKVFPVKVNFYFQKNMNSLVEMAKELDAERSSIVMKYGTPSETDENQIQIPQEHVDEVNKTLNDLFSLEQEVAVNVIELDWFEGVNMTAQEVAAITFMIKDEE